MKLCLINHDYKYAVEQILLLMFPEERPEYTDRPADGDIAVISLSKGKKWATAVSKVTYHGVSARGMSRVDVNKLTGGLVDASLLQKTVKSSFYAAAVKLTGKNPPWGELTGIRPGRLATNFILNGGTPKGAVDYLVREFKADRARASLCADTAAAGIEVNDSLARNDIALYVGIPFCPTRCAYCSFVSNSVEKSSALIAPFLDALFEEMEETGKAVSSTGLNVCAVYFGGGTPTTLTAEQLDRTLTKLEECFDLSSCREITVEAGRPDTVTREKLEVLKKHGVGRISINPQTMSDDVLNIIGRRHTAQDIINAYALAREVGFDSINMDLIAGLPGDTVQGFIDTLSKVLALAPENITVHTLALKKGSRITLEHTRIPDGNAVAQMIDHASGALRENGYAPYYLYRQKFTSGGFENVGWTVSGKANLYNIIIMEEYRTVIAMGGGGSTKLVCPDTGRIERVFNAKYPLEYINSSEKRSSGKLKIREFYAEMMPDILEKGQK